MSGAAGPVRAAARRPDPAVPPPGAPMRHQRRVTRPVFVDGSGRRRRLILVAGSAIGVLVVLALVMLVAGLFGASPVHLPGLPGGQATDARQPGRTTGAPSGPDAATNPAQAASPTASTSPIVSPSADPTSRRHVPTQTPTHPGGKKSTS